MSLTISDRVGLPPASLDQLHSRSPIHADLPAQARAPVGPRIAEPAYHPQVQPPACRPAGPAPSGPYALPPGSTLAETVGGTRAQPFDVTLSQLATAVYGTRGAPPAGWSEVTDCDLWARGIDDPQAWRLQFLGANDSVPGNDHEFRAEIYTDGDGNYVLAYRGTAEGADDWMNNFQQATGFQTDPTDKFSEVAVETAAEFQNRFGDGQGNLAITGHSQGGGLATMGSLATGIPAVTFDASGIHPNTLERIGIADPQQARDIAEGGQIRAYSLQSDLLTQAQESGPLGLIAPDALGTKIVVAPAAADANDMFTNYGPNELAGLSAEQLQALNTGVEVARHVPVLPLGPAGLLLTGGINAVGNLAYGAMSHSPDALTAAMIDHEPWQAGYENPADLGKDLQNLLPEPLKDDFARNTHDLVDDVITVARTDFANGDFVQGGFRIAGDVVEGVFNSTGDTVDRFADALAERVDARIDGWAGDVLAGGIDLAGSVVEGGLDAIGQGIETLADGAGKVAQGVTDFVGGLFGR
ncbi:DUF2974 domain-containing protein [Luteimonas sp. BDR2-5]|uniref:Mbeg1-like protein n=1 Tax=Proluteimonas luteida TaxID=2878685 RepID=UPI001E3C20B6|nr:Mbeg1-like protein [Luteimonas sp. BDR2-5]MCD9028002.1 DUF2974 domain-containing protein [Luteimonas sp. BDR2-5]